jgi:hypothetical protein
MPKFTPGSKPDPMSGVVDRLLAQLPGLQGDSSPSRAAPWSTRQAAASGSGHSDAPEDLLGPWARLALGLLLGTMIVWWPYPRSCGFPLTGYLGALLTIMIAGGWAAVSSWRRRAALPHVVALVLLFYGIMLGIAELLPRTGYAAEHATWQCKEPEPPVSSIRASML